MASGLAVGWGLHVFCAAIRLDLPDMILSPNTYRATADGLLPGVMHFGDSGTNDR